MSKIRDFARDQSCINCGAEDGTVVGAHYTGVRRHNYGGGLGIKVDDLCIAHLCHSCHQQMDTLSRSKDERWTHSEFFLHLIMLTLLRLKAQGKLRIS